ncbi:TetR/AcrR family transcriptional regulator [Pectinatus sottacetonis]|uniref:TetR/AcrR family transcriptional regulator n=1 Tax=Pectinatus sottacetonis TaxID=1002795 RepID=UPI0018C5EE4A|nr:TetR/AcrR family transcriptional regulator [Pectinatus sottacetonis]
MGKHTKNVNNTRQKILQAAGRVINSKGITALTLAAVAKEAGVSKGGLLYHFASKDELIKGINDFFMQNFISDVEHTADNDVYNAGRWTRAYIKNTFKQLDNEFEINTALLSVAATKPNLVKSTANYLKTVQNHIENDHINPILSTVIRLAVDGIYYNQLFGMNLEKDNWEQIANYLLLLTKEDIK